MRTLLRKMFAKSVLISLLLLLTACGSKISQQNFEKIQPGMTMQQVVNILGEPSNVESFDIAGLSGSSASWRDKNSLITIQFLNNQVKIKTFGKSSEQEQGDSSNSPVDENNH